MSFLCRTRYSQHFLHFDNCQKSESHSSVSLTYDTGILFLTVTDEAKILQTAADSLFPVYH